MMVGSGGGQQLLKRCNKWKSDNDTEIDKQLWSVWQRGNEGADNNKNKTIINK